MKTVADVILAQLSSWGIKNMYGVAGDAILSFIDAIGKQNQVQYYGVRHESSAAFMASTEGKSTQRIGVCLGTSGPGLVNMLNGIADAAADFVPMLVITGQVETKKVGTEAKQYVEQQQMIHPLAVYSTTLFHPEAIVDVLQKAIIQAYTKRGVAHVSIPKDLFSVACSAKIQPPIGSIWNVKHQDLHQLDQASMLLASSQKPIIFIGEGARTAKEEVIRVAEMLPAGIIETLGAKGTTPYAHPLHIGGIGKGGTEEGKQLLLQSDCVLVIGANWWPEGFVPLNTQVIQIDQSAANIESHKEVVCGLVGDASGVLRLLEQRVQEQQGVKGVNRSQWESDIRRTKNKMSQKLDQERGQSTTPIAPQKLIAAMDESVADDAIMVLDTGDHTIWFNRLFRAKQQQVLYSGKWRTMGYGLPAAISAKLQHPEKEVVGLIGDGCFAMTMMELATAVNYNVPIVLIVVNNGSLAMEKNKMLAKGKTPAGVELYNPDFASLAQAFGAKGMKVEQEAQLKSSLTEAIAFNQPTLIDVVTTDVMPPLV